MATKKKGVKVRDLKPSKDAKGGASLNKGKQHLDGGTRKRHLDGGTRRGN
jgi:hypothetical protein